MSSAGPLIELHHISKTFGGTRALLDVGLELRAGEVHGLVGQNGSGKSTLVKILSGYHAPDRGGDMVVRGDPVKFPLLAQDARSLGFSFVHQDLALIDSLTVLENLRVGRYRAGLFGRISWSRERQFAVEVLERFGLSVDPDAKVSGLRDADRAVLAIIRAVQDLRNGHGHGGLLVLDEPTVYLPRDAVERFFAAIRGVAAEGNAVLLVSHRLAEVAAVTDCVTVLRDARVVGSGRTRDLSEGELIGMILGRELEELYPSRTEMGNDRAAVSIRSLSGRLVEDLSFDLASGEIAGVTGLAGMGFEEVPYLLMGAERARGGTVTVGGRSLGASEMTPQRALEVGMALVPGNRARDGIVAALTVSQNVAVPILRRHFKNLSLRHRKIRAAVEHAIGEFDVQPRDPKRPMWTLSGGNQQKTVFAKWYQTKPAVLLLHEPTQGVDIGARGQIFHSIKQAADSGTAVLIASSEYADLANICSRVLIFRNGRVVSELSGADLTEERLVEQCYRRVSAGAGPASEPPAAMSPRTG